MHERENALKEWLVHTIKSKDFVLTPLAGDASFRRYFRLQCDGLSYVVMDAPPAKEDSEPFIYIAGCLAKVNVLTPKILAKDLNQGFLLLSDFGDQLVLNSLTPTTVNDCYQSAIQTLLKIQTCEVNDPKLPPFNESFMVKEMSLCPEWFFTQYLNLTLSDNEKTIVQQTITWIASQVELQPLAFIHRDYHSRNLMVVNTSKGNTLGVIDFQDAMCGPLTYDLVSLLKDCYISWPREQILQWVAFYYRHSPNSHIYSLTEFIRAFDLCGIQRHLKVLGIFCRLFLRDNKSGYLNNLPLTLKYVLECAEMYDELHPFYYFLQKRVFLS